MKNNYIMTLCLILFIGINETIAQIEWTGPMITFSKANFVDPSLEVNQDRITDNVWLSRDDNRGMFNAADPNDNTPTCNSGNGISPFDTEWAFGSIADGVANLTFGPFFSAAFSNCSPPSIQNQDAVLHLITDDIYIDIRIIIWTQGGNGGGFSYMRSTDFISDVQTACDSYTWIDGNTYTTSNNSATFTLTSSLGADSTVLLDLTINNATMGTDVQSACNSYTWIDGNTYTASNNTATFTTTNAAGCDSVVTLDLTINDSNMTTDVQSACGSFTWIDGNTYTASNNTATFTTTNAAGCDSVVTLDLTINDATAGTDVQEVCGSYTWLDGNTYTESNDTATFTLTNTAGCDSVVTLDLTINNADVSTSVSGNTISATASGASYQWIDCDNDNSLLPGQANQDFDVTANGNYAVIVLENNCIDTSMCVNISTVAISDAFISNQVSIYPNPTNGIVNIDLGELNEASFEVFNSFGQLIQKGNSIKGNHTQIDLKGNSGVYFIKISANEKGAIFKIIK